MTLCLPIKSLGNLLDSGTLNIKLSFLGNFGLNLAWEYFVYEWLIIVWTYKRSYNVFLCETDLFFFNQAHPFKKVLLDEILFYNFISG